MIFVGFEATGWNQKRFHPVAKTRTATRYEASPKTWRNASDRNAPAGPIRFSVGRELVSRKYQAGSDGRMGEEAHGDHEGERHQDDAEDFGEPLRREGTIRFAAIASARKRGSPPQSTFPPGPPRPER